MVEPAIHKASSPVNATFCDKTLLTKTALQNPRQLLLVLNNQDTHTDTLLRQHERFMKAPRARRRRRPGCHLQVICCA